MDKDRDGYITENEFIRLVLKGNIDELTSLAQVDYLFTVAKRKQNKKDFFFVLFVQKYFSFNCGEIKFIRKTLLASFLRGGFSPRENSIEKLRIEDFP